MRCERLALNGEAATLASELRGLVPSRESVRDTVAEIVAAVRTGGDETVLEYTRWFDTAGAEPKPLLVSDEELDGALARLAPELHEAIATAVDHVGHVAALTPEMDDAETSMGGSTVKIAELPVASAAVYVPGGRAPYPSTVVMGVVPALSAGVGEVYVCSPPGADGEIDAVVLAASRLAGATRVYRMGGAQAIAALAYGTQSVRAVEVIVGPGNLYVQEAKRQVYGQVGIDGFAGPSDLIVIADRDADPELLALDLLAQAEHGPGTVVIALSDSAALLDTLAGRLATAPDTGAVAALVAVPDAAAALTVSESFAPEHLQLIGAHVEALADQVRRAGCVFVGAGSGTAFGDYIAGSNHILPTGGTAGWASGVTPRQFRRTITRVRISDPGELAPRGAAIARAEGFELHARSMEARIRQNRADA